MKEPTLNKIMKDKNIYFISPHLDDAVFSCGSLLLNLIKNNNVNVINVFTKAGNGKQTISANRFLKNCNFEDPIKLFEDRVNADKNLFKSIGVNVVNLDYTDALWRTKTGFVAKTLGRVVPEFMHVYPIYRLNIANGKISSYEINLIDEIAEKLKKIIPKNSIVFCPFAYGSHVDHVIVRNACERVFEEIIYWSDFPYNTEKKYGKHSKKSYKIFVYKTDHNKKVNLMKKYKTQFDVVFPNRLVPKVAEKYYVKK